MKFHVPQIVRTLETVILRLVIRKAKMTIKNHTKTKQCACDMYKVIYLLSSRQKSHTAGVRMKMKNNRIITQIIS